MKNKIHKILGVGLTLVMALALVAGFAVPASAAVETLNEWYKFDYPEEGEDGDWFYDPDIDEVREITQAINGDLYVYAEIDGGDEILKSEDGGRTWEITKYSDPDDGVVGGTVFDMVCSSIDEDIVYATDGYYVYKTDDGGDTWSFVAKDSLEEALEGLCGCTVDDWRTITCIDVTYDDDDNPFVFIGTRAHTGDLDKAAPCDESGTYPGSVYWIGEAGYPATWTDLRLECYSCGGYDAYAIGCAPDWADSKETYVVVTTDDSDCDPDADADGDTDPTYDPETHVVKTIGVTCSWIEFAELVWDCIPANHFDIWAASRIGFPDDWEDTETLFVGVTDTYICVAGDPYPPIDEQGGDVYLVTDGSAIDLNVEGITTGCLGIESVDIISLDVMGDMDEASLIAGAFCDAHVYYSYDGGWEWEESEKDPTGTRWTYAIWYEDSALAATSGCDCAVSMSCGEEVGQYWNQISLINTGIDIIHWIDHSPGYITESETLFMLSRWVFDRCDEPTQSLFRYDGTYWERVYCSVIAGADTDDGTPPNAVFQRVRVSPDFNTTEAVYLTNMYFEIWRSLDAGCSWDKLTFPCAPRGIIGVLVVIDEDTIIAGGADGGFTPDNTGIIFKTTRHGARPWDEYDIDTTGNIVSFDLEPGYEDPGTVLAGDNLSQVFISEDGGETWDLVGDCAAVLDPGDPSPDEVTYVVFDPEYATNNTIYAAAGNVIARCIIDPAEDWADQEWEAISSALGEASGIKAAGDTALYVSDVVPLVTSGGVLRSLNPDEEEPEDVVFEQLIEELPNTAELRRMSLTTDVSDEGCAENVLWALDKDAREKIWVWEDTLAAPVVLDMPVEGKFLATTDEATLSWEELCGAECYEVELYRYCPECPEEKLDVDLSHLMDCHEVKDKYTCYSETCIVVDELESGCTYYWQVRVCIGEPKLSKWSEERTFTTAMLAVPFEELCSPPCGAEDVILSPNFSWGAVDGATSYNIELAPTETFTTGVIRGESTVNAWTPDITLEYAATYYWRVRAEKDGILSDWTVCLFTTMEEPVPPPPPVEITPPPAAPEITVLPPPVEEIAPNWIYAIIGIGAALIVVVIVLVVRTRRPPA